ncbi:hypothetical protein JX265_003955 [Neoarthrinium moseri]|uniref:Uncharacterized protein n=1 Tax=Neoarthrinium moseri TaxID=1658444 RepID=A0A9Q0ASN4_9PEZI|nr:hypothetical protein JX265_003955 [Neoarthrinium moseri]
MSTPSKAPGSRAPGSAVPLGSRAPGATMAPPGSAVPGSLAAGSAVPLGSRAPGSVNPGFAAPGSRAPGPSSVPLPASTFPGLSTADMAQQPLSSYVRTSSTAGTYVRTSPSAGAFGTTMPSATPMRVVNALSVIPETGATTSSMFLQTQATGASRLSAAGIAGSRAPGSVSALSGKPMPSMVPTPGGGYMASAWTKPEDLEAAAEHLQYQNASAERKKYLDIWAMQKASELAPCPAGYRWRRHPSHPGYLCAGGAHYIPDVMVVEGLPGVYTVSRPPKKLIEDMTPHKKENIPNSYFGPVRPEGTDMNGKYIYPFWA